jgi:cell shape-determining protein MreC
MIQESEPLRKLTTEEVYQDLYKQYKKSCIEIGKLNAEIQELSFLKDKLEKELSELKKPDRHEIKIIKRESAYIQDLLAKIKRLEDQNVRLRQGNGELISKLIQYEKQHQQ